MLDNVHGRELQLRESVKVMLDERRIFSATILSLSGCEVYTGANQHAHPLKWCRLEEAPGYGFIASDVLI